MSATSIAKPVYPRDITPEIAQRVELLPGLFWARLPLPFELNHINVWLLEEEDGWALIDTGLHSPPVYEAWRTLYGTLLDDRRLKRIFVTHMHPDHIGLAEHLRATFNAEVYMTAATQDRGRLLWQGMDAESDSGIQEFCRSHGIDRVDDYAAFITGREYRRMISGIPEEAVLITDDSELRIGARAWTPIITGGHAPGHMSLYCEEENLLVSGDQILPTITCNISVFASNYPEDALDVYLNSLRRFEELPRDTLVLPSHGRVFTGLHERIDSIRAHHRETLERVLSLCEQPLCLGEVAPKLFRRKLEGANYSLAMGEAMAHIVYLVNRDELKMHEDEGICYFVRAK